MMIGNLLVDKSNHFFILHKGQVVGIYQKRLQIRHHIDNRQFIVNVFFHLTKQISRLGHNIIYKGLVIILGLHGMIIYLVIYPNTGIVRGLYLRLFRK